MNSVNGFPVKSWRYVNSREETRGRTSEFLFEAKEMKRFRWKKKSQIPLFDSKKRPIRKEVIAIFTCRSSAGAEITCCKRS